MKKTAAKQTSVPRAIVPGIASWFEEYARALPWRQPAPGTTKRDPYLSLVSEVMLQQTQVSRVLEKFEPFIARFPTIRALAAASVNDVLAEWSGLGYYRRARNLHSAAQAVSARFDGVLPEDAAELMTLPGIGRYTAGAISSLVHNKPEPIVDGNVMRVLLRIGGREVPQGDPATQAWAWEQAGALVKAAAKTGSCATFNEGMMELGARICTPGTPRCEECPVQRRCAAFRHGIQDRIPLPKKRAARTSVTHSSLLVISEDGRLLVEQRPENGLWGGMWQAPTVETSAPQRAVSGAALARRLGLRPGKLKRLGAFVHNTTHREVSFCPWGVTCVTAADSEACHGRRWLTPAQIAGIALSNPQRRILLTLGVDLLTSLLCARAADGHHPRVQRGPLGPRGRGTRARRTAAPPARR